MENSGEIFRVLVCPLDWGLGHAARCIPLINHHLDMGHEVLIASCGPSGEMLKKEFPQLIHIHLPSFKVRYSKGKTQIFAIMRMIPGLIRCYRNEHRLIKAIVKSYNIDLLISDNRFGLWGCGTKTIYITHQLMVKMPRGLGFMEGIVHKSHCHIIKKYDRCAVPDSPNVCLSGDLANKYPLPENTDFVGIKSRFTKDGPSNPCDVLIIISGPEPQRSLFEKQMITRFKKHNGYVVMVRGVVGTENEVYHIGNINVIDYLNGEKLAEYIRGARKIICRSGYTTLMDLYKMDKLHCAELYPTPGQTEQEYLAKYCYEKKLSSTDTLAMLRKPGKLSRK